MRWLTLGTAALLAVLARDSTAQRTLPDYRYFRALSIDLQGRPPTRAELAAFEAPGFQLDAWIEDHLQGPRYAERIRRVYQDLLRLDLPEASSVFRPPSVVLRWTTVMDPDGKMIDLYFRDGQRRVNSAIDGQICFTPDETGLQAGFDGPPTGTARRVDRKLFLERTVAVKPWWIYADYASKQPTDHAGIEWRERYGIDMAWDQVQAKTVRVCREEAQTTPTGRVYVSGRTSRKGDPLLPGRLTRLPGDSAFALANAGTPVSCTSALGYESSAECGCGVGLERCAPAVPHAFWMPWQAPLGLDQPFESSLRPAILWLRAWWSQEPLAFIDRILTDDRDVREIVASRATVVNGPLAHFYRFFANAGCCGAASQLGYEEPEPLVDPARVPHLAPQDVANWQPVADRGPHAAGIMTMPIFLLKYGSPRQRAHAIYTTFLCREFVSESVALAPSNEPDLTKRKGCANCHQRLDPLAAYFARITDSDWTYLPPEHLPVSSAACRSGGPGCQTYYDATFTDRSGVILRNAYAAPDHADAGPPGLAAFVTSSPEFAPCVVRNVAQSLLGRSLVPEDDAWKAQLVRSFVDGGYRMRALVRGIVTSRQYRDVNDRLGQP